MRKEYAKEALTRWRWAHAPHPNSHPQQFFSARSRIANPQSTINNSAMVTTSESALTVTVTVTVTVTEPLSTLCSAQSPTQTAAGRRSMDFLASFNFRDEEPSRLDSQPHASIEELQSQLRDVFSGKVSETRAERVATRLDLAAATQLTLPVPEGDHHALDGLSRLDPSLGGARSTGVSTDPGGERTGRVVRVSDALLNQPADDPVLQKSIANHLVAAVGQVDGSEWAVREVSRATQDWVFSYVCKNSMQHWQRQHKAQVKPPVAEYSQREIDPLLASRPAFDCRGSLIISFSRNSRAIFIDYDHIPLHRTVAQLATLFKPPPPRRPLPTVDKQPKTPSSSRRKRDADKTPGGEGGKSRKRKRKTGDTGASGEQVVLLDSQEAAAVEAGQLQLEEGSSSSTSRQQHAQDATAAAQNSAAGLLTINVSPEEAKRRRNVAMVMLQGAGVDPDSLSPEQFNIFANQSPELQKESLNMLVKYGAERLRIVHPGNKEGSAPPSTSNPSSTPATQSNIQGSSSGPVTTNELVLQTSTPTNKKSRRKNQAADGEGEEADAGLEDVGSVKKTRRRKGTGKSRNACAQCKQRRVKCPRETPICSGCREAGLICEYAAPKPKKVKSNAIITTEDEQDGQDENEEDDAEAELHDETPPEDQQLHEDAEGYPELSDNSVHHQMPIGDVLPNNMAATATDWEQSHVSHNYFHHTHTEVSEAGPSQPSQPSSMPLSDLILPHGRQYYPNLPASEVQDQTQAQALTQPMAHKKPTKSLAKGSGRNAAMRNANQEDRHSSLNPPAAASDWSNSGNPVTQAAAVVAAVVTSMQSQEPSYGIADSSGRSSAWRSAAMPQALENSHQHNVAAASLQRSGAVSPMNAVSRATSSPRTGKLQKRGAVHETSATDGFQSPNMSDPKQQQQQQQSNAHGQGLQAPAGMAGSGTYNSYDRYSSTRAPEAASTDRITYEPYSYQRDATNSTSYTNYGHGSHATTTTTAAASMQAPTTVSADRAGSHTYGSYANPVSRNTSHTSQTSHMGSRGNAQAQDFGNNNADLTRNSRQHFNPRPQSSTPRPSQNAAKQDRSYSAYPSQIHQRQQQQQQQQNTRQRVSQQQQQQQPSQHQAWYGFGSQSGSGFAATSGHGSNYSWNMPGDS
ncbi:transcriptional regulator family: Fungal Specific TF [Trichoderma aggressivum f. europaeum]|uniref:Transcriptional regulator family: Fungal Specific TF n=1 Tax=Trichoderma aggressivum f. europaeum TaxID=173218 RepID=A0AAE1IA26_9HYPO|nr:transcriptional regulator family: Fungal Specific TF [Trichoderma aggressivum f. europaeum]